MDKGGPEGKKKSGLGRSLGRLVVGASLLVAGVGALSSCTSPKDREGERLKERAKSALVVDGVRDQVAGDVNKTVNRSASGETPPPPSWVGCNPMSALNDAFADINSIKTFETTSAERYALIAGTINGGSSSDIFYSAESCGGNNGCTWSTPDKINGLSSVEGYEDEYDIAIGEEGKLYVSRDEYLNEYTQSLDSLRSSDYSPGKTITGPLPGMMNFHSPSLYYSGGSGTGFNYKDMKNDATPVHIPIPAKTLGVDVVGNFAIVAVENSDTSPYNYIPTKNSHLFIYDSNTGWSLLNEANYDLTVGDSTSHYLQSPYVDTKTGNLYFTAAPSNDDYDKMKAYECTPTPRDGYCLGTNDLGINDLPSDCCADPCVGQGCSPETTAALCGGTTPDEGTPDNAVADNAVPDTSEGVVADVIQDNPPVEDTPVDTATPDAPPEDTTADPGIDPGVDSSVPVDEGTTTDNGTEIDATTPNFITEIDPANCNPPDYTVPGVARISNKGGNDCSFAMDVKNDGETLPAEMLLSSNATCPEAIVECAKEGCALVCGTFGVDDNGQGISTRPYGEGMDSGIVGTKYLTDLLDYSAEGKGKIFQADIEKGCMWYESNDKTLPQEKVYLADELAACIEHHPELSLQEADIYTRLIAQLGNYEDNKVKSITKEKGGIVVEGAEVVEGVEPVEVAEVANDIGVPETAELADFAEVPKDVITAEDVALTDVPEGGNDTITTEGGSKGCNSSSSPETGGKGTLVLLMATAFGALLRKRLGLLNK
jgi:uncharacterized protein (TIGR03382 family)